MDGAVWVWTGLDANRVYWWISGSVVMQQQSWMQSGHDRAVIGSGRADVDKSGRYSGGIG